MSDHDDDRRPADETPTETRSWFFGELGEEAQEAPQEAPAEDEPEGEPDATVAFEPADEPTSAIPESRPDLETLTFASRPGPPAVPDPESAAAQGAPPAPERIVPEPPQRPEYAPRALSKRRYRTLAAVADAIVPPGGTIPHSAGDVLVAERTDAVLATLGPDARRTLERLLTLWEWMPLLSRYLRPFSAMTAGARAAFVERAAGSRRPWRRQALAGLKFYCLNGWASSSPVEEAIGVTYGCTTDHAPRDGAPLEVVDGVELGGRDHVEECDVVVVGSGAGGAAAALECAEAGLSVVVLEEGGHATRDDFTGPPWQRFLKLYRAGGSTVALGNPPIPVPLGMGVGGTTLVNAGTCFRTPDRVLERWERAYGIDGVDPASMRPLFERVEQLLSVKQIPEELLGGNARVFRRGAEALGLHGAPLRRAIEGCRGCGACIVGCPSDAKQSVHLSYLPRAQRHGAGIFSHARADRIIVRDGRAQGVVASVVDPATGEKVSTLTVRSKAVVLAAGAIHTPALLARNALGNRSGMLGRGLSLQPTVGVAAFFDEDVTSWRGTVQSFGVDDWAESQGILVEATALAPSLGAGSIPGVGVPAKDLVARYRNLASAGLLIADRTKGRVMPGRRGEPVIVYRLNDEDARTLTRGIGLLSEIFLAGGARVVMTGLPQVPSVSGRADLEALRDVRPRASLLRPTAFHPTGTARMGADPSSSVVGPDGRVHGLDGLYVADASVLPAPPEVNPQVTIMAFATRIARELTAAV